MSKKTLSVFGAILIVCLLSKSASVLNWLGFLDIACLVSIVFSGVFSGKRYLFPSHKIVWHGVGERGGGEYNLQNKFV